MLPLDSFLNELIKIGTARVSKVEAFHSSDSKDWKSFEKSLSNKGFQGKMLRDERTKADPKLEQYIKNFGSYLTSKKEVGKVTSGSGSSYSIRELPGGRLGCGCKDWQYSHSHKGTDCRHLKQFKDGVTKKASSSFFRGVSAAHNFHKRKEQGEKGKMYERNPHLALAHHH